MGALTLSFFILFLNFFAPSQSCWAKNWDHDNHKDAKLAMTDLITGHGYPLEEHFVTTQDGYILRLHRIPHGKKPSLSQNKVVLLVHGFGSSSYDWVLTGPDRALGFILADHGYDVWLANTRGNHQSRNHTTMNPDEDPRFWQFTWHECGTIDLPNMIDYILEITSQSQLYNIGHSYGANVFYAMASELPEYNEKVIAHFSLGPTALLKRIKGPFQYIADNPTTLRQLNENNGEIFPYESLPSDIERTCRHSNDYQFCETLYSMFFGLRTEHLNASSLSDFLPRSPSGGSFRQLEHFIQNMRRRQFCKFNYSTENENLIKYRKIFSPCYDLQKITTPIYLFYSIFDQIVDPHDVQDLCTNLEKTCVEKNLVDKLYFNHGDFLFGLDVVRLVYEQLLSLLNEPNESNAPKNEL